MTSSQWERVNLPSQALTELTCLNRDSESQQVLYMLTSTIGICPHATFGQDRALGCNSQSFTTCFFPYYRHARPLGSGPVLRLLSGQKWVFRPARATRHCSDKREILHGAADRKFHVYRGSPKTVKIWHCAHKFAPRWRLVCTIFTKFSICMRL